MFFIYFLATFQHSQEAEAVKFPHAVYEILDLGDICF